MKTCSKCGETKDYSEFQKNKSRYDGVDTYCKPCRKEYNKRPHIAEARKKSRIKTNKSDKRKTYRKQYYELNKDRISERKKEWKNENKDRVKEKDKLYRQKNREAIREKNAIYLRNNKHIRDKIQRNRKYRYNNDASFRIRMTITGRVRDALKHQSAQKNNKTMDLLGCTKEALKLHLESQFYTRSTGEEMSWDNYGLYGWHIDHKKPCAKFDLTDPEQQKECFHYTNLQPLWAEDNLRKSDKWDG